MELQSYTPISPNRQRANTIIMMFYFFMVLLVVSAMTEFFTAYQLSYSEDFIFSGTIRLTMIAAGLLGVGKFIGYIFLGIFFIMWMRRAYHNLHKAGSGNLRHSEGWASGAWFVPFLNLAWPFQIMRDIWEETQKVFRRQDETYERKEDYLTFWWWTTYLIAGFIGEIGSITLQEHNREAGYGLIAVGTFLTLISAFLTMMVIRKISKMEDEMFLRAQVYYAWVSEQYGRQYQQAQNQKSSEENQNNNISEEATIISNPDSPEEIKSKNSGDDSSIDIGYL